MRRLHLLELHEQTWYPSALRALFQSGLGRSLSLIDAFGSFIGPLRRFLEKTRPRAVLDLCSGSGEATVAAWSRTLPALPEGERPRVVLSDLFPHLERYVSLKAVHDGWLDFAEEPVDAARPPAWAPRVRTFFNSFHHFPPETARAILADAAREADGIAIYEIAERSVKHMLGNLLVLPFASAFLTAFVLRPFRLRNLVFGLLVPVIPLTAVVDGVVSNLRSYTPAELDEMTRSLGDLGFDWEIGRLDVPRSSSKATYLLGWRRAAAAVC